MRLVPDVLERIFAELAQEQGGPDTRTLSACSLVSRDASTLCERYLYSCISVCNPNGKEERFPSDIHLEPHVVQTKGKMVVSQLLYKLAQKPYLSRYIRRIGVLVYGSISNTDSWWILVGLILEMLQLDEIRYLHLNLVGAVDHQIHPALRGSITRILKSRNLRSLHASWVRGLIPAHDVFVPFPRLTTLYLSHVKQFYDEGSNPLVATNRWQLDTVSLRFSPGVDVDSPIFDISGVSRLCLSFTFNEDPEKVTSILQRPTSLKHLTIISHFESKYRYLGQLLQPSAYRTLETLSIVCAPVHEDAFGNLMHILEGQYQAFTNLRMFELVIVRTQVMYTDMVRMHGWSSISSHICQRARFPNLRTWRIFVGYPNSRWVPEPTGASGSRVRGGHEAYLQNIAAIIRDVPLYGISVELYPVVQYC